MRGELRKRIERCRKFGDVTRNGIVFDWELASSAGAAFELFREPHHTDDDIAKAESQLRQDRDVVSVSVTNVSESELSAEIPPEPDESRIIQEAESRPFHTILPHDIAEQRIHFLDKVWRSKEGAFPHLQPQDAGKRLVLLNPDLLQMESREQLVERTAALTEYPRGGDVARLASPWRWASTLKVGALGFIDGCVNREYLISVQITFNSVPFLDSQFCSASGGPGSIATPITELKPTRERVAMPCWMWKDGRRGAHKGVHYERTCRIWDWYPND